MKKLILLIIAVLALASCTKHYLPKDMLTYEIDGKSGSVDYWSNTSKSVKTDLYSYTTWRYNELVGPGDSISLFIIDRGASRSSVKIYLGSSLLYTGETDNTGLLFINYKFHREDFRLK